MALQTEPIHEWNRSTPNDGNYFNDEFSKIYENFDQIENEDFTFNGHISVRNSLTVNNKIITGSALELIPESAYNEERTKCIYNNIGLFKVILRKKISNDFEYKTFDCGMYSRSYKLDDLKREVERLKSERIISETGIIINEELETITFKKNELKGRTGNKSNQTQKSSLGINNLSTFEQFSKINAKLPNKNQSLNSNKNNIYDSNLISKIIAYAPAYFPLVDEDEHEVTLSLRGSTHTEKFDLPDNEFFKCISYTNSITIISNKFELDSKNWKFYRIYKYKQ